MSRAIGDGGLELIECSSTGRTELGSKITSWCATLRAESSSSLTIVQRETDPSLCTISNIDEDLESREKNKCIE